MIRNTGKSVENSLRFMEKYMTLRKSTEQKGAEREC